MPAPRRRGPPRPELALPLQAASPRSRSAWHGLAVLPCYIADAEPGLVRLLGPRDVVTRELWLVLHRDSRRIGRIRAFVDHFTAEIQVQAASLHGEQPAVGVTAQGTGSAR